MKAVGKYVDVDSEDVDNSSRCSNDELPSDGDDDIIVDEDVDNDSMVDSEEQNSGEIPNSSPTKTTDDKVMRSYCLLIGQRFLLAEQMECQKSPCIRQNRLHVH